MEIPSPRPHRRARIEIIPLIDIIFFLLATFVMVSLSMVKHKGISVSLPSAATSQVQEPGENVVISVNHEGKIYYNKDEIPLAQLPQKLAQLNQSVPDPKVFIQGDEKAFFG